MITDLSLTVRSSRTASFAKDRVRPEEAIEHFFSSAPLSNPGYSSREGEYAQLKYCDAELSKRHESKYFFKFFPLTNQEAQNNLAQPVGMVTNGAGAFSPVSTKEKMIIKNENMRLENMSRSSSQNQ